MYELSFDGVGNAVSLAMNGWGIDCELVSAGREQAIIRANDSIYRMRALDMSTENIGFVHEAKEYIAWNGYDKMDRYLLSAEGNPYFTEDGVNYVLTNSPCGRECDFGSNPELKEVSKALGMMHKASCGFKPLHMVQGVDYLGLLPSYYKKRCDEMKRHLKDARRGKGKFDFLYAQCGVKYCELAEDIIDKLEANKYNSIIDNYRKNPVICHHDIIYRNTILGQDGVNIINFEMCCIEIRSYDIINLIRRRMRKCGWDCYGIRLILDSYREVEELEDGELEILKLMLVFPQKLWRIVNKYYNSRRGWGEKTYVAQLMELIDEMEDTSRVMQELDKQNFK